MTREEIERSLTDAINKLNCLEKHYLDQINELKDRVVYLEEMCASQKNMLADSVQYIKNLEDKINSN